MTKLQMKKLLTMAALAGSLSVATMAEANAWTRSGTVTGPNGNTVTRSGSGGCAGGVCTGTRTTTGPRGNSVTRSGVATRGYVGPYRYRGYRYGGVAAGAAVGAAVGAAAATSVYVAPAPAYVAAPVVYVPRAYYYPGYYYGPRPYNYPRTLAYYRPY
jgi:hypothetical protein